MASVSWRKGCREVPGIVGRAEGDGGMAAIRQTHDDVRALAVADADDGQLLSTERMMGMGDRHESQRALGGRGTELGMCQHGISRTATALGLDYYSLKKRVETAGQQPPSPGPAFVELPAPLVVGKQALFELDNGAGASMRVQLLGYEAADVEALARRFWDTESCCRSRRR